MTEEYRVCLKTVPFRKGEVWIYDTSSGKAAKQETVQVLIEGIDFGVTEALGAKCYVYGRYLNGSDRSGIVPLKGDRLVSKVEVAA